jgi:glycosyltransferase involved in cell wall biosynthesis
VNLSVLIPVYNEENTIREVIRRVQATGLASEIVIVDDGSRDRTREILSECDGKGGVRVVLHEKNAGKGAALRTAIGAASGDVMLVQDADLEYDPGDYPRLLQPLEDGIADVVYGSRFLGGMPPGMLPQSAAANKVLTVMTNVLFGNKLTDMETCYKVFRRDVVAGMRLRANRFDFEPEFTAKVLKSGVRIYEVQVSFNPREYAEGKKIGPWDGVMAVWALLKYRFMD